MSGPGFVSTPPNYPVVRACVYLYGENWISLMRGGIQTSVNCVSSPGFGNRHPTDTSWSLCQSWCISKVLLRS